MKYIVGISKVIEASDDDEFLEKAHAHIKELAEKPVSQLGGYIVYDVKPFTLGGHLLKILEDEVLRHYLRSKELEAEAVELYHGVPIYFDGDYKFTLGGKDWSRSSIRLAKDKIDEILEEELGGVPF